MFDRLIIFVKAPRLGFVKTRLAKHLGNEAALDAYRTVAQLLLSNLKSFSCVELRFSPDEAINEISPWLLHPEWTAQPQGNGDLGQRLTRAFDEAFSSGARSVAIIGSDCPDLLPADIEEAWVALESNDLVLGPAQDGGYWLIALRKAAPMLFEGVAWSSEFVLEQTMAKAAAAGLKVHLLRQLADIDTASDWERFVKGRAGR